MRHAEEDVRLFKAANLNYLRTTHYPPNIELVEAADKYGMYLEVEAPFCWVAPFDDMKISRSAHADLRDDRLLPLAPERDVLVAGQRIDLQPVLRDVQPDGQGVGPHAADHLQQPRSQAGLRHRQYCTIRRCPTTSRTRTIRGRLLLGEYFFPVCHEQTDVRIDPGLREFYGFGHSEPDSAFGRQCAESFTKPFLKPCTPPGAWSHIVHSQRVMGAAMFGAIDDSFYFADGTHAGYAWHHGFWGLIDAWRRPKPEWWLAKMVFSPVWFHTRHVDYSPGQASVTLPVENRYSFTDFSELTWSWVIGQKNGEVKASVAPGKEGKIEIPIPKDTPEGAQARSFA